MFSAGKSEGYTYIASAQLPPLASRSQHHKKHRFTAVFTVTLSDIHTNKEDRGHYQQLKQLLPVRINTEHLHFASLYLGTHQVGRHSFATALGVRQGGGDGTNQHQSGNRSFDPLAPTPKDYAEALGVKVRGRRSWQSIPKWKCDACHNSSLPKE